MSDFSPELLQAREMLLAGIMATWPKKDPPAPQPLVAPVYPISLEAATAVTEHYRHLWLEALAEKEAVVATGTAARVDGYWKREERARGLYVTSCALLEALIE